MSLTLHSIKPARGSRKSRKRVGRGLGSKGSYSGRGVKGQRARSGGRSGLQLLGIRPLMLKLPKRRGFGSLSPKPEVVSASALAKVFKDGATVTPKILLAKGLVGDTKNGVKILGGGELKMKLTVRGCAVSAGAKAQIEQAGGSIL